MPERMDRVLILLFSAMVFFTGALFSAEVWFKSDGQFFQVVSGVLTAVTGAFLARIKPASHDSTPPKDPGIPNTQPNEVTQ